jgi:hypothetical protein
MLDEKEWAELQAVLYPGGERSGWPPFRERAARASSLYETLTGLHGVHYNTVSHHRASHYGPPCRGPCGKPLRTPRAALCAARGADVRPANGS